MRGTDIFASVPSMLMAICIVSALGANTINLYSELDPRAMQAYLSGTPAADTLSALKEIPLGFEDTFVGLTGRY